MAKKQFNPSTSIDQDGTENPVYHRGIHIDHPKFDFEDSFCRRIDKLIAIADLFFCAGAAEQRELTTEGSNGLYYILMNNAEELRTIGLKMLYQKGGSAK